jgi:hypothetical protein
MEPRNTRNNTKKVSLFVCFVFLCGFETMDGQDFLSELTNGAHRT